MKIKTEMPSLFSYTELQIFILKGIASIRFSKHLSLTISSLSKKIL